MIKLKIDTKIDVNVTAALDKFSAEIREKVAFSGAAAMAQAVYDEVQQNVPVDTGLLKSAVYQVHSPEKSTEDLKTYRVSYNKRKAPHGHLVEFGTSRAPAHPFLRPAFDKIGNAIKAGKERMAQRIEEIKAGS